MPVLWLWRWLAAAGGAGAVPGSAGGAGLRHHSRDHRHGGHRDLRRAQPGQSASRPAGPVVAGGQCVHVPEGGGARTRAGAGQHRTAALDVPRCPCRSCQSAAGSSPASPAGGWSYQRPLQSTCRDFHGTLRSRIECRVSCFHTPYPTKGPCKHNTLRFIRDGTPIGQPRGPLVSVGASANPAHQVLQPASRRPAPPNPFDAWNP